MQGGHGEPGAEVPWAGRLRPGKQAAGLDPGPAEPRLTLPSAAEARPAERLVPTGEEPSPWLEAPDEFDDHDRAGRWLGLLLVGFVVLAVAVGGLWWAAGRVTGGGEPDGSLIRAERGPYKVRPTDPGGKTFAGTGDSAFAVSQGESRGAALADAEEAGDGAARDTVSEAAAEASGGSGVQVGAFMDAGAAEAGWASLAQRNPVLAGVTHRVMAGRGDIGTVYRLQAMTANPAAASALCQALRDGGQECRVNR